MLPGVKTTAGRIGYTVGAIAATALCAWGIARALSGASAKAIEHTVVCGACGAVEPGRAVAVRGDGTLELPAECATCGKRAAFPGVACPACHKLIPFDRAAPPAACMHCKADLSGMFDRPTP